MKERLEERRIQRIAKHREWFANTEQERINGAHLAVVANALTSLALGNPAVFSSGEEWQTFLNGLSVLFLTKAILALAFYSRKERMSPSRLQFNVLMLVMWGSLIGGILFCALAGILFFTNISVAAMFFLSGICMLSNSDYVCRTGP